jgi:hypothetical protein
MTSRANRGRCWISRSISSTIPRQACQSSFNAVESIEEFSKDDSLIKNFKARGDERRVELLDRIARMNWRIVMMPPALFDLGEEGRHVHPETGDSFHKRLNRWPQVVIRQQLGNRVLSR